MPTARWSGSPAIKGSSEALRMMLLTASLIGLQFTWGIEMTYCTPYLLSLGLTKSKTSLVWIAGPLSGLIMQPLVGAITDRSTSNFGRRRPFMIGGSVVVGAALLTLGWTSEIVGLFASDKAAHQTATIVTAVLAIYVVDFSINAVQACCRSLIVDVLPIPQQQTGSAWAARMSAAGHVIGYFIGTLDMVNILPNWLGGDTQFKKMTVVSSVGLWIAVGVTSWGVTERVLVRPGEAEGGKKSVFSIIPTLWHKTLNLPPRIQAVCWVQFWSWVAWFPFLFYSSTWVGETYYRYERSPDSTNNKDALGNIGRLGSLSLVMFSLITFTSSIILPYIVSSPDHNSTNPTCKFTPRPPPFLAAKAQALLVQLHKLQPDIVTTWCLANILFGATLIWAPFVRSVFFATVLVAFVGIPWSVCCWAPFSEMGVEINRLASTETSNLIHRPAMFLSGGYEAVRNNSVSSQVPDDEEVDLESVANSHTEMLRRNSIEEKDNTAPGELAGIYLGVLNVYTTLPQFVGTFMAWVVFSILEPARNDPVGDDKGQNPSKWLSLKKNAPNAISVLLCIGAMAAFAAAEAARRLKKLS